MKHTEAEEDANIIKAISEIPIDPSIRAYRILAQIELPFPRGAIQLVAEKLGIPRWRVDRAAALRVAFEDAPQKRARLEPLVLNGVLSIAMAQRRMEEKPLAERRATDPTGGGLLERLGKPKPKAAATPSEDKPKKQRRTSR